MVERVALEAVRSGATPWDTVAAIRAWLHASDPLPPPPLPAQQPPAPAAPAAGADAEAAAAAARGEAEERVFAREFSWDAAKRGAAADQARAEADEARQGGPRRAEAGRELRVMERVAGKLRHELEHKHAWFRLVRAAPDAAAAACSQVTGRGALGPAVHCTWGAEGNWGGAWWWVGVQAEQAPFDEPTLLSPEEEQSLLREPEPPVRRCAGSRGLPRLHQVPHPGSRAGARIVRRGVCRRGRGRERPRRRSRP